MKKGYKNTEVGVIPEDWSVKLICDVAIIKRGKFTPRPRNNPIYYGGDIPFVQTGDVTNCGGRIYTYTQTLNKKGLAVSKLFNKGTILMTIAANIGYTGILELNMACPDSLLGIDGLKADNGFLNFYFQYRRIEIENLSTSGAQKNLNIGLFNSFQIPLPPTLKEQQAIATVLSDTDTLLSHLKTLINKKKAIKQGAMQELLTGKKRLDGFSGDWEVKTLGEIAEYRRGSFPQPYGLSKWYDDMNGMPFVQVYDVDKNMKLKASTKQSISELAKPKSVFVKKGTIIITIQGSIGRIAITQYDAYVDRTLLIFTKYKIPFDRIFFAFILQEKFRLEKENAPGGTIKTITKEALSKFEMYFPKFKEQQAIAQILTDMDTEIETLEKQLQKTQDLKQGLMQELLTGKIRLVKPISKVIEVKKKEPVKKPNHNKHFNDAVMIGTLAKQYGSEKFPLTRFKYTKVSYLFKRYREEKTEDYLKKAAGPYNPQTRYGGAEKIALTNKYIKIHTTDYKGKKYQNFLAGESISEALNYFTEWYGNNSINWVNQFKFTTNNNLELWATVDMAIEDLKLEGNSVTLDSIKQLLNDNKNWRPKLKRGTFSDTNIKQAMAKIKVLFG